MYVHFLLCPLDANPNVMTNVARAMSCPYNGMEDTNDDSCQQRELLFVQLSYLSICLSYQGRKVACYRVVWGSFYVQLSISMARILMCLDCITIHIALHSAI